MSEHMMSVVYFSQVCLIVVFGLSAVGKIKNINGFSQQIQQHVKFSKPVASFIAHLVLGVEVLILVTALSLATLKISLLASISLLIFFTLTLIHALIKNIEAPCGCFGDDTEKISIYDVLRNLILICVFVYTIAISKNYNYNLHFSHLLLMLPLAVLFALVITRLTTIARFAKV